MIGPILSWNIRDIGTYRGRLKKLVVKMKPKIVALMEPFALSDKVHGLVHLLKMDQFITNEEVAGTIWVFWHDEISVQFIKISEQFTLHQVGDGIYQFLCHFAYAKCTIIERRVLWEKLNSQA